MRSDQDPVEQARAFDENGRNLGLHPHHPTTWPDLLDWPGATLPTLASNYFSLARLILVLSLIGGSMAVAKETDELPDSSSASIIEKYLQAQRSHEDALRGASMQVDISASVPALRQHGRLRALRKISRVGQVTYRVLGFQGDNTVKRDVIARFLQAEQQGQRDQAIAITPANYKFKFKGTKPGDNALPVYVFQLTPRTKKVGLFKGQLWLDCKTYLPVVEKGRFVKNPSIFFKRVDFERNFRIKDGIPIPEHMNSTIDVRLIGKVELTIDYSNFDQNGADREEEQPSTVAVAGAT